MSVFHQYLTPETVAVSDAADKRSAIEEALSLLSSSPRIADADAFRRGIWAREEALPTGLGAGIGAPHARLKAVRDPVASFVALRRGIDYGSLDGVPVRLILLVGMPENSQAEWLRYLAQAAQAFRDAVFRRALMDAPDSGTLWELIKDR